MNEHFDPKLTTGSEMHSAVVRSDAVGKLALESASYPGYSEPELADSGSGFAEFWWIIQKRLPMVLAILFGFLMLGVIATLLTTKRYTAVETLQIDRNAAKIVEGGNISPVDTIDTEFMKTQYEVLQSRSIATRVVSKLQLGQDPAFIKNDGIFQHLGRLFGSKVSAELDESAKNRRAVDVVLQDRTVKPVFGSRLVDVGFTDTDPARAQRIAQELAEAFINATLDKRFEANSYAKSFLEDQLKQLQTKLQESENARIAYGEKEQIVGTNDKSSIPEENLSAANIALGKLITDRITAEQNYRQASKGDITSLKEVLASKVIEDLRTTRSKLLTDYQDKRLLFKADYPEMRQLSSQIAEVDKRILFEANKISASLKSSYESALAQESEMQKRVETLKADVLDLQKRSIVYNGLKREADVNRSLYDSLLQRFKEVSIAGGVGANNIFVVDKAELPQVPSSPKTVLNMLLALFIGSILGIAVAFLLEWMDDSIHSAEDLEKLTGLSTLGIIPRLKGSGNPDADLAIMTSAMSEAYRSLCTSLYFAGETGLPKMLFLTSSGPSEGKTTSAIAIAKHFASIDMKVLLIDGDLRKAMVHSRLGLHNSIGLSNFLVGACTAPEALQHTSVPNLTFMSSGPLPPNAAQLLASPRVLSLLSASSHVFDLIVIDGAPIMGLADALLLANASTATIFVAAAEQTRKQEVRAALRRLRLSRAFVIGSVLTKHSVKRTGYGASDGYGTEYGGAEISRMEGADKQIGAVSDQRA